MINFKNKIMTPRELRIGNLLKNIDSNSAEYFVLGKNEMLSLLENENEYLSWVDPIPLTEEWFERFMLFKLTIKSDRWYNEDNWVFSFNGKIQCGEFFITTNDFLNFNFYIATIDDGMESWEYITEFKYVHQLQNLYFAITNEELILKA